MCVCEYVYEHVCVQETEKVYMWEDINICVCENKHVYISMDMYLYVIIYVNASVWRWVQKCMYMKVGEHVGFGHECLCTSV